MPLQPLSYPPPIRALSGMAKNGPVAVAARAAMIEKGGA
jgi:hypothetical protein